MKLNKDIDHYIAEIEEAFNFNEYDKIDRLLSNQTEYKANNKLFIHPYNKNKFINKICDDIKLKYDSFVCNFDVLNYSYDRISKPADFRKTMEYDFFDEGTCKPYKKIYFDFEMKDPSADWVRNITVSKIEKCVPVYRLNLESLRLIEILQDNNEYIKEVIELEEKEYTNSFLSKEYYSYDKIVSLVSKYTKYDQLQISFIKDLENEDIQTDIVILDINDKNIKEKAYIEIYMSSEDRDELDNIIFLKEEVVENLEIPHIDIYKYIRL